MSFIAEITLDALRAAGAGPLPGYTAALTAAEEAAPPPFAEAWYGQKFRRLAADGRWLAQSLVTNATIEGDGARELWKMAAASSDAAVAQRIKRHALDESRHARLYVTMLRLAFPGVVGDAVAPGLRALSPGYRVSDELPAAEPSSDDALLDDLIQMNLGEIRTRVHQLLLRPVIAAHARGERVAEVGAVLEALLRDETAHILYTAQLIEQACASGRDHWVRRLMAQRLGEFNEITLREVGDDQYTGE
jgi:hypothetical protein